MHRKLLVIVIFAATIAQRVEAADPAPAWTLQSALGSDRLKLSGSSRLRYEALQGQPRTNFSSSDELISMRNTLSIQYLLGAVRFGAEIYEGRAYLAKANSAISTNEVNALEPVQAYVAFDLNDPAREVKSLSVQAGRFIMNLGSRRLVTTDDYRNTANGFTGIRTQLKTRSQLSIDVFYTYPQLRLPDDVPGLRHNDFKLDREGSSAALYGVFLGTPRRFGGGALELGWLGFHETDAFQRPTRDRNLRTVDLRYLRESAPAVWDLEVEGAYQYGHARNSLVATSPLRDVSAAFYHLRIGYQWAVKWKPHLSFDYDLAGGDGGGSTNHRFDTLFGMRRGDFAPSGLYNLVGRANLNSPGLRLELAPSKRLDTLLTYRALWLASGTDAFSTIGVRDSTGSAGDFAGQQFDTRVRYWLIPSLLRFEVDGVLLFKGKFLRAAPNARDDGNARFISLNLQATF